MMGRAVLWACLALLAALVIGVQLDRQAYRDPTVIPLVPGPMRAVAAQRQLELTLALGGQAADLARARHLVRLRPVPARHLLLYAQTAQQAGAVDQVIRPLEVAAARGWREPALQMLAGQAAVAGGNQTAAVQRAAALIATGTAPDQTVQLLAAIMRDPTGRAELAGLVARPGYYSGALWRYFGDAGTPAQVLAIAAAARRANTAIDCPAVTVLADSWRGRHLLAQADRLQALGCPAG